MRISVCWKEKTTWPCGTNGREPPKSDHRSVRRCSLMSQSSPSEGRQRWARAAWLLVFQALPNSRFAAWVGVNPTILRTSRFRTALNVRWVFLGALVVRRRIVCWAHGVVGSGRQAPDVAAGIPQSEHSKRREGEAAWLFGPDPELAQRVMSATYAEWAKAGPEPVHVQGAEKSTPPVNRSVREGCGPLPALGYRHAAKGLVIGALHSHWSSVRTASAPGDCGANVCKCKCKARARVSRCWLCYSFLWRVSHTGTTACLSSRALRSSKWLALGKLRRPTECGCGEMNQAPARSRCWAGPRTPPREGLQRDSRRGTER